MSEATADKVCRIHDGLVLLRSGGKEYRDTAANYALDAGGAFPASPPGDIGRLYIPGEKHRTTTGRKATPQPFPWAPGDVILADLDPLIEAKAVRETLPPRTPPTDDELLQRLENSSKALKAFLLLYAEREGVTVAQLRSAIKAKMATF
jgi:hypothetical protein